jgi:hypothetical protein
MPPTMMGVCGYNASSHAYYMNGLWLGINSSLMASHKRNMNIYTKANINRNMTFNWS